MANRIYVSPARATISRPGVDAVSPPQVSSRYLALDTRLVTDRPLQIGITTISPPSSSLPTQFIAYGVTYPVIPAVDCMFNYNPSLGGGQFVRTTMRLDTSNPSEHLTSSPVGIRPYTDGFMVEWICNFTWTSTIYITYYVWQVVV